MAESNNPLLARAKYLAYGHGDTPPHLRPKALTSVAEAFGEVPPSPEEAEISERLAAYKELLQDDIPTPLQLTESVEPDKLAAAVKRESEKFVLRSYLETGQEVTSILNHKLRGLRRSAASYQFTMNHLAAKIKEQEEALLDSVEKLGGATLADTSSAIERDAAATGRLGEAIAHLSALSRVSVRDRERESRDRVAIIVKPLFEEAAPLRVSLNAEGEEVLSSQEDVDRHQETKLLFALWKKSTGLALAAVALGVLPSYEVGFAPDWNEVARRYDLITTSASREVETQAEGLAYSSSKDDNVRPAPNWD